MRILLAESRSDSSSLIALLLTEAGHTVMQVSCGEEAFEAFESEPFPVIIADLAFPGMSGYELCRRIRNRAVPEYVYVILIVKQGLEFQYHEAEAAEADDVLPLPIAPDILKARLRVAERILNLYRERDRLLGLIPICAYCKKIRQERGLWQQIEAYVTQHSDALFTHTICPECAEREFGKSAYKNQIVGPDGQ